MAKRGKVKKLHRSKDIERPLRIRKYKQYFLIVCEDEKTEPSYFIQFKDSFPEDTMYVKPVGTGKDSKGVVMQAIQERDKLQSECKKEIDFVWAVFDKDDADENETKIKRFEDAFFIANKENIEIAYSNEVFELWLLLHIKKVSKSIPLSRAEIYNLLQKQIRKTGHKFKDFVYDHYKANNIVEIINEIGDENEATKKAVQLAEYHKNRKPIEANPSTKVHILVKELRSWIKYYNE